MYVLLLLVVGQHHGEPVPQGKILPCEVKAFAALGGPDRANARPDFLAHLVFARGLAVVEDVGWSVWHRNVMSDTAFSVGDWQDISTLLLIHLSYSSVPKLCVPVLQSWISANGESVGLHRGVGFCLHLVSLALAAAVLESYTAPPTPLYRTLPTGDTKKDVVHTAV